MIKVVLCGYRNWALRIFDSISLISNVKILDIITSKEDYLSKENDFNDEIDIILFIGWSWIIPHNITEKFLCLGIHPSDLPYYRGGSPLQHQIINGIEHTKVTLMTLSSKKLDAGEIWCKEDLSLDGKNMDAVFLNLIKSSNKMLNSFFNKYPNIIPMEQEIASGSYFKRRKPEDSKLTKENLQNMSLKEIYNFTRALTDPYPNAYIEDEYGNILKLKEVEFIESKETKK